MILVWYQEQTVHDLTKIWQNKMQVWQIDAPAEVWEASAGRGEEQRPPPKTSDAALQRIKCSVCIVILRLHIMLSRLWFRPGAGLRIVRCSSTMAPSYVKRVTLFKVPEEEHIDQACRPAATTTCLMH